MARKPINYWEKRSTELMKRIEKRTENTINSLIKAYEQATKDINKEKQTRKKLKKQTLQNYKIYSIIRKDEKWKENKK